MLYFNKETNEMVKVEDICSYDNCSNCKGTNENCRKNIDFQNVEDDEFEKLKKNIEKNIYLKVLNKVNKMSENGISLHDIRMCLFNSWVKYEDKEQINKNYEII